MKYLLAIFTSYAITFVIASSSILEPFREWFKNFEPRLKINNHKHFIECRMCVGFWVSWGVATYILDWTQVLVIYGASYFLATQER